MGILNIWTLLLLCKLRSLHFLQLYLHYVVELLMDALLNLGALSLSQVVKQAFNLGSIVASANDLVKILLLYVLEVAFGLHIWDEASNSASVLHENSCNLVSLVFERDEQWRPLSLIHRL